MPPALLASRPGSAAAAAPGPPLLLTAAASFSMLPSLPARLLPPPQEKGWDVDHTIEKLLQTGSRISAEAHEVVRIPGLLTDADMIGAGAGAGGSWAGRMPLLWGQSAASGLVQPIPAQRLAAHAAYWRASACNHNLVQATLCGRTTAPRAAGGPRRSWTRSTCPLVR